MNRWIVSLADSPLSSKAGKKDPKKNKNKQKIKLQSSFSSKRAIINNCGDEAFFSQHPSQNSLAARDSRQKSQQCYTETPPLINLCCPQRRQLHCFASTVRQQQACFLKEHRLQIVCCIWFSYKAEMISSAGICLSLSLSLSLRVSVSLCVSSPVSSEVQNELHTYKEKGQK